MFALILPVRRASESRWKGIVGDRRTIMNLKAHLPIIALCGLTFAVSFAAGLWWELSQQEEWGTSASSGEDVNQSIAKRQTDKEKSKSEKEGPTDTNQEKTVEEKDEPAESEGTEENTQIHPVHAATDGSPSAAPAPSVPVRGGRKRLDISNLPEEQRAKIMEARQRALETATRAREAITTVEISSDSESTIDIISEGPDGGEVIIMEPDN
jgi:hypothetical protein